MCQRRSAFAIPALIGAIFLCPPVSAESNQGAPSLARCETAAACDLGLWDDVWQGKTLVLRRGANLSAFSPNADDSVEQLGKFEVMEGSQIKGGGVFESRLWIWCDSKTRVPFALDLTRRKRVDFTIDGLKVPGKHSPGIQSWVMTEDAGVFMVSGGDKATWPRDGNRPIYFWLNFLTGESRKLPTGWDLNYLSADQSVATFWQNGRHFAIAMKSGKDKKTFPDRDQESTAPFVWTVPGETRPLVDRESHLLGLSHRGEAFPMQVRLANPYVFSAKTRDDWAAFHLRGHGSPRQDSWSLWLTPLEKDAKPRRVGVNVREFVILVEGRCVYTTREDGDADGEMHSFVYDAKTNSAWNLIEGVPLLPRLPDQLRAKPYIQDNLRVRLIADFGRPDHRRFVLAFLQQHQGDNRALRLGGPDQREVETIAWKGAVLVSSDGKRFLVNSLADDVFQADQVWLHPSGALIWGKYEWIRQGAASTRKMRLHQIQLQPGKNNAKRP